MRVTKQIHGKEVQVSSEDEIYLHMYKWFWRKDGYLVSTLYEHGRRKTLYLHSLILPPLPGFLVDHWDCDKSNNSRPNLRYLTPEESSLNTPRRKGSKWPKGVTQVKNGRFRAQCKLRNGARLSSYHKTARQAGVAYDMFVHTHAPFVAYLNFPDMIFYYEQIIRRKNPGWHSLADSLSHIRPRFTPYDPAQDDWEQKHGIDDIPEI